MGMVTPRDRVWMAALTMINNGSPGFDTRKVYRVMKNSFDEGDVPSRKTVRDTLDAMAELGVLTTIEGGGRSRMYREPRE